MTTTITSSPIADNHSNSAIAAILADLSDDHALTVSCIVRSPELLEEAGISQEAITETHISKARHILNERSRQLQQLVDRHNGVRQEDTTTKPTRRKHTQKRHKLFGFAVTAVIRWMGVHDFNFEDAGVALATLGAGDVSDVTIRLQLKAGRDGKRGPAADLTPAQAKTVREATM